jgi:hypothetical protein
MVEPRNERIARRKERGEEKKDWVSGPFSVLIARATNGGRWVGILARVRIHVRTSGTPWLYSNLQFRQTW